LIKKILKKVENIINGFIQENKPVITNNMKLEEAQEKEYSSFL